LDLARRGLLRHRSATAAIEDVDAEHEAQHQRDKRAADAHPAPADHSPAASLAAQVVEIFAWPTGCPAHRVPSFRPQ
jgi:hypothetical protein